MKNMTGPDSILESRAEKGGEELAGKWVQRRVARTEQAESRDRMSVERWPLKLTRCTQCRSLRTLRTVRSSGEDELELVAVLRLGCANQLFLIPLGIWGPYNLIGYLSQHQRYLPYRYEG